MEDLSLVATGLLKSTTLCFQILVDRSSTASLPLLLFVADMLGMV